MSINIENKNIFILGTIFGRIIKLKDVISIPEIKCQLDDIIKDFTSVVGEVIYDNNLKPDIDSRENNHGN